jgi:hypothetical protein
MFILKPLLLLLDTRGGELIVAAGLYLVDQDPSNLVDVLGVPVLRRDRH